MYANDDGRKGAGATAAEWCGGAIASHLFVRCGFAFVRLPAQ